MFELGSVQPNTKFSDNPRSLTLQKELWVLDTSIKLFCCTCTIRGLVKLNTTRNAAADKNYDAGDLYSQETKREGDKYLIKKAMKANQRIEVMLEGHQSRRKTVVKDS